MDDLPVSNCLKYSDLDTEELKGFLRGVTDGIDRDRLFSDERFPRVRHPLIQARVGRETALNFEIHNLITGVVSGLTISEKIGNAEQIREFGAQACAILLELASDPEKFKKILDGFKAEIVRLNELNSNPDDDDLMYGFVSVNLRRRLAMPSVGQEFVVYPAVHAELVNNSRSDISELLTRCRDALMEPLEEPGDETNRLRSEIEAETVAVLEWYSPERS